MLLFSYKNSMDCYCSVQKCICFSSESLHLHTQKRNKWIDDKRSELKFSPCFPCTKHSHLFLWKTRKLNALLTTLFYELSCTTLPPKSHFQGQGISWPMQHTNVAWNIPGYCWDVQWNKWNKDDKRLINGKVHVSMESFLNTFI